MYCWSLHFRRRARVPGVYWMSPVGVSEANGSKWREQFWVLGVGFPLQLLIWMRSFILRQ
jgi:hypothetical protein